MRLEFDRVANSPGIRKDVARAVEILLEDGYQLTSSSALQTTFEKGEAPEGKETVFVFHGYLNGTMMFNHSDGSHRTVMAWDYVREKRPTAFQKTMDRLKDFIGWNP